MNNLFLYSFIFIIILTLFVSLFGYSENNYDFYNIDTNNIYISSKGYTWPIPNKYYISSYFGYRNLNIYGASNYHSGIDIPRK